MSDHISQSIRDFVAERAGFRCEYCGTPARFSSDSLSVDHIVPRSSGGSGDVENLCLACQGCNNFKYVRTEAVDPVSGISVRLFYPRTHLWSDHFSWTASSFEMMGLTPIGRATIDALRLNRPGVVNLRRVLWNIIDLD